MVKVLLAQAVTYLRQSSQRGRTTKSRTSFRRHRSTCPIILVHIPRAKLAPPGATRRRRKKISAVEIRNRAVGEQVRARAMQGHGDGAFTRTRQCPLWKKSGHSSIK